MPKTRDVGKTPLEEMLGIERDEEGKVIPKKRKPRSKTIAAAAFGRARVEAEEMMRSCDWTGCTARHLLALYDVMHEKTYGVAPEMTAHERYTAVMLVANFVKRSFADDFTEAVAYFRWVWTREIGREKWRRENGRDGGRIGVGLMFSGALSTDFKVARVRDGAARSA